MQKKKKAIRRTTKKTNRSAKLSRARIQARKKKPLRKQKGQVGVIAVEVFEVESIGSEDVSGFEVAESKNEDDLDEHFPPDYGGSE